MIAHRLGGLVRSPIAAKTFLCRYVRVFVVYVCIVVLLVSLLLSLVFVSLSCLCFRSLPKPVGLTTAGFESKRVRHWAWATRISWRARDMVALRLPLSPSDDLQGFGMLDVCDRKTWTCHRIIISSHGIWFTRAKSIQMHELSVSEIGW